MSFLRTHLILHHTGAEEKDTAQIRRTHLQWGWRDIGYNYVVERDGKIKEGRSPDIPGAHCRADRMNYRSLGVAVIGNLERRPLEEDQLSALWELVRKLQEKHRLSPENILPHRKVSGARTSCPGKLFPYHLFKPEKAPEAQVLFRVQVGAFRSQVRAEKLRKELEALGYPAFLVGRGGNF